MSEVAEAPTTAVTVKTKPLDEGTMSQISAVRGKTTATKKAKEGSEKKGKKAKEKTAEARQAEAGWNGSTAVPKDKAMCHTILVNQPGQAKPEEQKGDGLGWDRTTSLPPDPKKQERQEREERELEMLEKIRQKNAKLLEQKASEAPVEEGQVPHYQRKKEEPKKPAAEPEQEKPAKRKVAGEDVKKIQYHSGTFGKVVGEQVDVWSCCLKRERDAIGCVTKIVDTSKPNFSQI